MNAYLSLSQYGPIWLRQSLKIVDNDKYQIYYNETCQQNELLLTVGIPIQTYQTHEIRSYEYILFESIFRTQIYDTSNSFSRLLITNAVDFTSFAIKDDFLQLSFVFHCPDIQIVKIMVKNILQLIYKPQVAKFSQTQLQQLIEYHISDYYDILAYSQLKNRSYKEINIDLQNLQNANAQITKIVSAFHKTQVEKAPFVIFISSMKSEFLGSVIQVCDEAAMAYGIKQINQSTLLQPNSGQLMAKDLTVFVTHDIKQNNQLCAINIYGIGVGSVLNIFAADVQIFLLEWMTSKYGPITDVINKVYQLQDENPQQMHEIKLTTNFLEKQLHYKIAIKNVNGSFSERILWEIQNLFANGIYDYIEQLNKDDLVELIQYSLRKNQHESLHFQIINDLMKIIVIKHTNQQYVTPSDIYGPLQLLDFQMFQQSVIKHQFLQIYDYWTPSNINLQATDKEGNNQNVFINNKIQNLGQYFNEMEMILPYIQNIEIINDIQSDSNFHLLQGNQNVFMGNQSIYNKIVHSALALGSKMRTQQIILHIVKDIKQFVEQSIKQLVPLSNLIVEVIAGWKYNPKAQIKRLLKNTQIKNTSEQICESTALSDEVIQPQIQFIQQNSRALSDLISLYENEQVYQQRESITQTSILKKLFAQSNFQIISGVDAEQLIQTTQTQENVIDEAFNAGVLLQQKVIEYNQQNIHLQLQVPNQQQANVQSKYQLIYTEQESNNNITGTITQYKVFPVLNNLFLNIIQNQQLQDYYINYDQYTSNRIMSYIIIYLEQGIEYESDEHLLTQFKNYIKNLNINYNKLISNIYMKIQITININLDSKVLPLEFYQYINYLTIIYNKIHEQIQYVYEQNSLQIRITTYSIQQLTHLFKMLIDKYVHKKIMYDDVYFFTFINTDIASLVLILQAVHDYIWVNNIATCNYDINFFDCNIQLFPQHISYQQQYNKLMQQICYNCYSQILRLLNIIMKKFTINSKTLINDTIAQESVQLQDICNQNMILEVKECISNDVCVFIININNKLSNIEKKIVKYYYQILLLTYLKVDQLSLEQSKLNVLYIKFRASQQDLISIIKLINQQNSIQQLSIFNYLKIYQQINTKLDYPITTIQNALNQLKTYQSDIRTIVITRQMQSDQQEQLKKQKQQYELMLQYNKQLKEVLNISNSQKAILSCGDMLHYQYVYKDIVQYDQNFNIYEHLECIKQVNIDAWKLQQNQQIANVRVQIKKQKQSIILKNQCFKQLQNKMDEYDEKYINTIYKYIPAQTSYSSVIVSQKIYQQEFNQKQQQQLYQLHTVQSEQKKKQCIDLLFDVQLNQSLITPILIKNDEIQTKIKFIRSFQLNIFKTLKKMFNITTNGQINGYAIQPFQVNQKIVFKNVPQLGLSHSYIFSKQDIYDESSEYNIQEILKLIKQDKIFQIETALYLVCQLIEYLRSVAQIQLPNSINVFGLHTAFIKLSTKQTLQPLSIDIVNGACEYSIQSDFKPKIRILKNQSMFQSNTQIGSLIPISKEILSDADKYNICIRLLAENVARLAEHFEVAVTTSNMVLALREIIYEQIKRLSDEK